MKFIKYGIAAFCVLGVCGPLHAETTIGAEKKLKADVVLFAVPIKVKALDAGTPVDALEASPETMGPTSKAVLFRIERIIRGNFKPLPGRVPSVWDQAKSAAGEKSFLKLVTMDFERPNEEGTPKVCFSMAVSNPSASFGIKDGAALPKQRYKISLTRIHKDPDSYILIKMEKR